MGLTKPRAAQIFNLDYKQATRVVTTTNITLTGGAPSSVDGVSLTTGDRVLVTAQTTGSQNGLYKVTTLGSGSNGTWARTSDGNDTGEIEAGMIVMVTEGSIYADIQWKLITDDPIVIGTTTLTFTQIASSSSSYGDANVVTLLAAFGSNSISTTGNITAKNLNSSNADLAEMYSADADYAPGTVIKFGGSQEITITSSSHCTQVAGIVSTSPSYLMNIAQIGNHVLPVALTGRVPCSVVGTVQKGDRLVSSNHPGVAQALNINLYQPGCIVGKALEEYNSTKPGVIEIAVGRT
jgi:hypothetical protein